MKKRFISGILLLYLVGLWSCVNPDQKLRVEDMRCEYLVNPTGVDVPHPRFSWVVTCPRRAAMQSAYRVVVTGPGGKRVWDSGKILSGKTTGIAYRGTPLESAAAYTWQVTVWDDEGRQAAVSDKARFGTGLLKKDDWQARWISAGDTAVSAPLLRKEFTLDKKIRSARVFVTGLGDYELYLNGKKAGDHVMDPGRTDFRKRVLYAAFDVTDLLHKGKNAAGIILGNGTYRVTAVKNRYGWSGHAPRLNTPRALMQLHITFTDGTQQIVTTDDSWKSSGGPIVFNHVYGGEDYDARREKPGWSTPGYDDSRWTPVRVVTLPGVILKSQLMPPMKVTQTITPVAVTRPEAGLWLFDLGQNFAGWWRIRVRGESGVTVRVRAAETLNDSLFPKPLEPGDRLSMHTRHKYHTEVWTDYTLKGKGTEQYEPRFFYTGFRYAEVTTPDPGRLDTVYLEGRVVHTALEKAGTFESSDTLLNRIWRAAVWSQRGNQHSVPTDCPHREKGAYTGDGEIIAETSIHDFRMGAFYTKWLNDMADAQEENGRVPNTAPYMIGGNGGGIPWGSACILLPWWMHQYYLDTTVMARHYGTMKRYLAYLHRLARTDADPAEPYIINDFGSYWLSLGEWCAPGQSDGPNHPVVSTAYYYLDAITLSKIAEVLGRHEDARRYAALADTVKKAFIRKFFNPETNLYGTDTLYQTYQVLALALDLVPEDHREAVTQGLIRDILDTHHGHLNTGIIGTKYLWPVLNRAGRNDVAYTIVTRTTYPGYGYWISKGATTLWEKWEGLYSHNHQMFGSVSEFFYKYLAGIRSPMDDGTSAGYRHIRIQPFMPEGLSFVRASVRTVRGRVTSSWHRNGKEIRLEVEIPANSDATIALPVKDLSDVTVTESGKTVWEKGKYVAGVAGITGAVKEKEHLVFSTGSGKYIFVLSEE